jgi:cytochrome b subunit of formate dehydrogenase
MAISFTALMITGLPQRYALTPWAETTITLMTGIESVRIIHRVAAIIFMLVMIYHFAVVAYKIFVLRLPLTMMPVLKDATDLLHTLRYYIGAARQHPKMPRYNYAEKMEYWAVIWGGVLMTITGFMLWNPIATTNLLPGEFVPAARAAHSAEAWLAFLAILIWHFYWVHLKFFNRSMFNGYLTREQMELEHGAELEDIEAGRTPVPPSPQAVRQRERLFMPVAVIIIALSLVALYYFVTFEQTAITTLPQPEQVEAFVPATPTPTPVRPPTATPDLALISEIGFSGDVSAISHPIAGREDCLECHGPEGPLPYPLNHDVFELADCQVCHALDGEKPGPEPVRHSLVERELCQDCHQPDLLPQSHQEADFNNRKCLVCHPPAD